MGNSLNRPVIGERAMEKENQFTCFVPYSVLQFRTLTIGNLATNKVQSHMLNEKPNMPQYISEATYSHHSWGCGSICKWTLLTIANPFPAVFTSVPRNHETYSFFFPPLGVYLAGGCEVSPHGTLDIFYFNIVFSKIDEFPSLIEYV